MSKRPNILFLFPDQWRWDWLGCHDGAGTPYGDIPVQTPHIDRLAARGVRFTQCRSNSPICSPARACLAQGLRYEQCGVRNNGDYTPTHTPTIFGLLRDAGYHTATCGKSDLFKPDRSDNPTGFNALMQQYGFSDGIDHRGKADAVGFARAGIVETYTQMLRQRGLVQTHLDDHPPAPLQRAAYPTPLPTDAYTDDFCGHNALRLIDRAPSDRPWMLWVNFPGPHDPFDPPAEMLALYDGVRFPPPICPTATPPPYRDNVKDRPHYAACCTNIDRWVGRLIEHLQQRGELDRTLIIFSSDHGEMLGDHGRWNKSVPWEGSVHVPLIVAGPGVPRGQTCDDLVELIDVGAMMLAGAEVGAPSSMVSRPPQLFGGSPRDVQLASFNRWKMSCDHRYKLVLTQGEDPVLYDRRHDAGETRNVAADHPQEVRRLAACLPAFETSTDGNQNPRSSSCHTTTA